MIRDDEFKRLIKYAQGLGIKVTLFNESADESAYWLLDGTEIVINTKYQNSKTELLLSFIHELGHHLWYVHERDRKPDLKFEEAIHRENHGTTPPTKKQRKRIYEIEKAGTSYWYAIYKEINLKFPLWKLYATMDFDVWMYEIYYKRGKFPTAEEKRSKKIELKKKHKGEKYV